MLFSSLIVLKVAFFALKHFCKKTYLHDAVQYMLLLEHPILSAKYVTRACAFLWRKVRNLCSKNVSFALQGVAYCIIAYWLDLLKYLLGVKWFSINVY